MTDKLETEVRHGDRLAWITAVLLVITTGLLTYTLIRAQLFRDCMSGWAQATNSRANSLQEPANARVKNLLDAFDAALAGESLSRNQRRLVIADLERHRDIYPKIPEHSKLLHMAGSQLVIFDKAAHAVDAQRDYTEQLREHPVPSSPTCGGIF